LDRFIWRFWDVVRGGRDVDHVNHTHELVELVLDALLDLGVGHDGLLDLHLVGEQPHFRDLAQQAQRFEPDVGVGVLAVFQDFGHRVAAQLLGLIDKLPVVCGEHADQVLHSFGRLYVSER